jgi:hypothetical protein
LILIRRLPPQQLCNGFGSGLMNRRTNRHLYGLQIQLAALMAVVENALELLL